jgi:hypothetical protein
LARQSDGDKLHINTPTVVDFRLRNDNFENEIYKPLLNTLSIFKAKFRDSDNNIIEKESVGALLTPFLEAVRIKGLAGLGDDDKAKKAFGILLKNRVSVSSSSAEVKEYFDRFFSGLDKVNLKELSSDPHLASLCDKVARDAAREVSYRYYGADFDGTEVAADLGKGMTLGVAAGLLIDSKIPSDTAISFVLNLIAGGVTDIFLDNWPAAKVNTNDAAKRLGIKMNAATLAVERKKKEQMTEWETNVQRQLDLPGDDN